MLDYTVTILKNLKALSLDAITEHLGNPDNVVWRFAGDLLTEKLTSSCVDGRESEPAVGTPGGDLGGLIDGVIVSAQQVMRRDVRLWEIDAVLEWYLATYGSAYMHTDNHALNHVLAIATKRGIVSKDYTVTELTSYLRRTDDNPSHGHDLRSIYVDEGAVGCGHMAQMLKSSGAYNTEGRILRQLIRAFYTKLWSGDDRCKFRVLVGEHTEGAVLNVLVIDDPITPNTPIPLVRPSANGISMFVNHPQVVGWLEQHILDNIYKADIIEGMNNFPIDEYKTQLDELIKTGTRETISRLATGLPLYNILFKPRGLQMA